MLTTFKRLLAWLRRWKDPIPPGSTRDPYARKPVPLRPSPKGRQDAIALAEPDDD